jgi:hypothetical protein
MVSNYIETSSCNGNFGTYLGKGNLLPTPAVLSLQGQHLLPNRKPSHQNFFTFCPTLHFQLMLI